MIKICSHHIVRNNFFLSLLLTILISFELILGKLLLQFTSLEWLVSARLMGFVIIIYAFFIRKSKPSFTTPCFWLYMFSSASFLTSFYLLFSTLNHLPLCSVGILFFLPIAFSPLIARIWIGYKIHRELFLALFIMLIGIICLIFNAKMAEKIFYIVGIFGSIIRAISIYSQKRILLSEPPFRTFLYLLLLPAMISLVFFIPISIQLSFYSFLLTLTFILLSYSAYKLAKKIDKKHLYLASFCSLILLFVLDWTLFHSRPDWKESLSLVCLLAGFSLLYKNASLLPMHNDLTIP